MTNLVALWLLGGCFVEVKRIERDAWYTMKQAAELLQVTERTLARLVKSGVVRGRKVGRLWRFRGSDLLDVGK
jgi:excisionase family DNA binding protein